MSGTINFPEFLNIIEHQKDQAEDCDDDGDLISAFVACGGKCNKEGHVKRETLIKIIKYDFGLTIDIEALISKVDADDSGEIEFEEFKILLT
jgi:calmodulin